MGVLDNNSVSVLEEFFSKFLDHIVLKMRNGKTEIHFAQLCILSWHECFIHPSQQLLGEIISHLIFRKFFNILDWFTSFSKVKHDNFSICFHSIVLVSIIRLVDKILTYQGYTANS